MRSWRTGAALGLGLAAVVAGGLVRQPARAQAEPGWLTDYEEARSLSRRTGKPLLVAFR